MIREPKLKSALYVRTFAFAIIEQPTVLGDTLARCASVVILCKDNLAGDFGAGVLVPALEAGGVAAEAAAV